jgi:cathepsin K
MKNKFNYVTVLILCFSLSCEYNLDLPTPDSPVIPPDDIITIDPSPNDFQITGVNCDSNLKMNTSKLSSVLDDLVIPDSLAIKVDLSENMPPVRSQGYQGSCVSWAIAYYLKSYQEKIQHGYEYETFENVMSPAFIYNQVKGGGDCLNGSSILTSLMLLQEVGVTTWKDFPYSEEECDKIPDDELIEKAKQNRIGEIGYIPTSIIHDNPNYTLINILKTFLQQETPVIMSLDIKNVAINKINETTEKESYHLVTHYNFIAESCGHALLLVGYDDELQAFKFVNSWGSGWKDEGYAWIHYNFFLQSSNDNYEEGVQELYVAFDEEDTETPDI